MTCCIIPARGGSTRIPNKNIRDFNGKPIIQYSIDAARESGIFSKIIVSTDSEEIADVVRDTALVYMRPKELGKNEVGTQEVVKDTIISCKIEDELTCCIYPTAPMIEKWELSSAETFLNADKLTEYIIPVAKWLSDPGRWYFGRTKSFAEDRSLTGIGTRLMRINPKTAIDINTEEDFFRAEIMYLELIHGY